MKFGRIYASLALIMSVPAMAGAPMAELTTETARENLAKAGPIENMSLSDLSDGIHNGTLNSEAITAAYLERIAEIDDAGPMLNAVIATFPDALEQARALDGELRTGEYRGPLHGIPILLKDNIEAQGALPTTAGSLALKDNITNRDATLVARLREAGAVILGKTNLSEWANIRSNMSSSGWSAIGGLTKNPHVLDRNTCGSSSGSGAATAAGLAAAAIGTETDGSVVCPSSINGIVGFKPTVGMVPRTYIVPISHTQDTAGPMTRTVRDAAILLTRMAGTDHNDPATVQADTWRGDFSSGLSADGLKGVRLGVLRDSLGDDPLLIALFNRAIEHMRAAGATIVDIENSRAGLDGLGDEEGDLLFGELKYDMATYLQSLPAGLVPHKNLADLIAFNNAHADTELAYFDQSGFDRAENNKLSVAELDALAKRTVRRAGGAINALLVNHQVDLLVQPTNGPAWITTLGKGDNFTGPSASELAAIAGNPHLTVPMGAVRQLPVGVSFTGAKWHDYLVLKAGHAYEQASQARVTPQYLESIDD